MDPVPVQVMKQNCEANCFSTLNHILAFCYNDARVIRWLLQGRRRMDSRACAATWSRV